MKNKLLLTEHDQVEHVATGSRSCLLDKISNYTPTYESDISHLKMTPVVQNRMEPLSRGNTLKVFNEDVLGQTKTWLPALAHNIKLIAKNSILKP